MRVTEVLQKTNIPDYSTALMSKQPRNQLSTKVESFLTPNHEGGDLC